MLVENVLNSGYLHVNDKDLGVQNFNTECECDAF